MIINNDDENLTQRITQAGDDLMNIYNETMNIDLQIRNILNEDEEIPHMLPNVNEFSNGIKGSIRVMVTGVGKSGKTYLLNTLLKSTINNVIFAEGDTPCTSRIIHLHHEYEDLHAIFTYKDGNRIMEKLNLNDGVPFYISRQAYEDRLDEKKKINEYKDAIHVDLFWPCDVLKNHNLEVIDSPGTNQDKLFKKIVGDQLRDRNPEVILYIFDASRGQLNVQDYENIVALREENQFVAYIGTKVDMDDDDSDSDDDEKKNEIKKLLKMKRAYRFWHRELIKSGALLPKNPDDCSSLLLVSAKDTRIRRLNGYVSDERWQKLERIFHKFPFIGRFGTVLRRAGTLDNVLRNMKSTCSSQAINLVNVDEVNKLENDITINECSKPLTILLVGRTNTGKTTLVNALTGNNLETSVKDRTTKNILGTLNKKWISHDGSKRWNFTIIDTPGFVDDELANKQMYKNLERLLTNLVEIDAVIFVIDGQQPVLDHGQLQSMGKIRDIFGDALDRNWALFYSKWFEKLEYDRIFTGITRERIVNQAIKDIKSAKVGKIPSNFFFGNSKPGLDVNEFEAFEEEMDKLFSWIEGLKPMNTKNFNNKLQSEKHHLEIKYEFRFRHLWDFEYKVIDCLEYLQLVSTFNIFKFIFENNYNLTTLKLYNIDEKHRDFLVAQSEYKYNKKLAFAEIVHDLNIIGNYRIVHFEEELSYDKEGNVVKIKIKEVFKLYFRKFEDIRKK